MFTLYVYSPRPKVAPSNTINNYALVMPEGAAPILKARVFSIMMHHLYDVHASHDLSTVQLVALHDKLEQDDRFGEHHFVIDGLLLSLLKRFCVAEHRLANQHKRLSSSITNSDYWVVLGELLANIQQPTKLQKLSFFA